MWNRLFKIDYFTCRFALTAIAEQHNSQVEAVTRLDWLAVEQVRALGGSRSLAFYHDDDDIFDVRRLAEAIFEPGDADVLVVPLIRIHGDLITFAPEGVTPDPQLGQSVHLQYRYQTDNYGLNAARFTGAMIEKMKDHVEASTYAEATGLVDAKCSATVSATIKTPASASHLPRLLDGDLRTAEFNRFIEMLDRPDLNSVKWLQEPLHRVSTLFRAVYSGATAEELDWADILPG